MNCLVNESRRRLIFWVAQQQTSMAECGNPSSFRFASVRSGKMERGIPFSANRCAFLETQRLQPIGDRLRCRSARVSNSLSNAERVEPFLSLALGVPEPRHAHRRADFLGLC